MKSLGEKIISESSLTCKRLKRIYQYWRNGQINAPIKETAKVASKDFSGRSTLALVMAVSHRDEMGLAIFGQAVLLQTAGGFIGDKCIQSAPAAATP
jgi:hypothetical protein